MTDEQYRKAVASMPQRKFVWDRSGKAMHALIIDSVYGVGLRFILPPPGKTIEWPDIIDLLNNGLGINSDKVNVKDYPSGRVIFGGNPFQCVMFAYRNDSEPSTTALHAHECFHMTVAALRARNVRLDEGESSEEAYAYFLEFIIRELETMKRNLPKICGKSKKNK